MDPVAIAIGGVFAILALTTLWRRRRAGGDARHVGGSRRVDAELHRARAAAAAETEEHDIDDMIDAIGEYRRCRGRREIGEELADELLRGTWDR